jgi:hypothetical protein
MKEIFIFDSEADSNDDEAVKRFASKKEANAYLERLADEAESDDSELDLDRFLIIEGIELTPKSTQKITLSSE